MSRSVQNRQPIQAHLLLAIILFIATSYSFADNSDKKLHIGGFLKNPQEIGAFLDGKAYRIHDIVFGQMGYSVEFARNPYLRNLQLATSGALDGLIVYSLGTDNRTLADYPDSLIIGSEYQYSFTINAYGLIKSEIKITNEDDLKLLSLGSMLSLRSLNNLLKSKGLQFQKFKDYTSLFRMLQAERVDAILVPSFLYRHYLEEELFPKNSELIYELECVRSFMGFSIASLGSARASQLSKLHSDVIKNFKQEKAELFLDDC